jgi:hypothetical protein
MIGLCLWMVSGIFSYPNHFNIDRTFPNPCLLWRGAMPRGFRAFHDDSDRNVLSKTTFKEFMSVLAPYFWPEGTGPRARAVGCFTALLLSKIANIYAPLFMGKATENMVTVPPIVPIGPLVA